MQQPKPEDALNYLRAVTQDFIRTLPPSAQGAIAQTIDHALKTLGDAIQPQATQGANHEQ